MTFNEASATAGPVQPTMGPTAAGLAVLCLAVLAMLTSTAMGLVVIVGIMTPLCLWRPNWVPVLLLVAFIYQNLLIAALTPLAADAHAFDTLRGTNFVMLCLAYGVFLVAPFLDPRLYLPQARVWLLGSAALFGLLCFYWLIGAVTGDPKSATVYFRNTLTPLACLHVALVVSSLYKVDLVGPVTWLGGIAVLYGYAELFFTVDFLSLFNGDEYIALRLRSQIESGYWERVLHQTGFVLRGLEDVMTVPLFNFPGIGNLLPTVFRLSGPNFHPISFAYCLAVIAAWLLYRGRPVFSFVSVPILVVVGSKGALLLLLMSYIHLLVTRALGFRAAARVLLVTLAIYLTAAIGYGRHVGDYHVLGFLAGLRDFLGNPLGVGLGFGGNLSEAAEATVNWSRAQQQGIADTPVESAIGVMMYQLGLSAFVLVGFVLALGWVCLRAYDRSGRGEMLFGFVSITVIVANSVLQEEAFYSPLALGLCLLLTGTSLGSWWRDQRSGTMIP